MRKSVIVEDSYAENEKVTAEIAAAETGNSTIQVWIRYLT